MSNTFNILVGQLGVNKHKMYLTLTRINSNDDAKCEADILCEDSESLTINEYSKNSVKT